MIHLTSRLEESANGFRLTISAEKTKVIRMGTNEGVAVNIHREAQEVVTWVKYTLVQPQQMTQNIIKN